MKCHFLHKLPTSEIAVKLVNEPTVSISHNKKILVASYDSANKAIVYATESSELFQYKLEDKSLQGPFPIRGYPRALRTFDQVPGLVFVAIE